MYWGPGVCNNRAIVQMHWLYNKHMTLNEDWHLEIFNHSTGTNTSEYLLILKADSSPIFSLKYHAQYDVLTALSLAVNLHDLCLMSREWNRPSRWLVFCSKNGMQVLLTLPFNSQSDNIMCLTQLLPFLWHLKQIKIMISVYIGKCKITKMSNSESTGHN